MKIDRPGNVPIIVGKRVTLGALVGGVVSFGVWLWNATQEFQVPAEQAVALTTIFTAVSQVIVANRYGITK
jgi:hypothetical protein